MKKGPRKNRVLMADSVLANSFYKLNEGNSEEKELYSFINRAMDDLAKDPFCGIKIRSQQWPKDYIKKH